VTIQEFAAKYGLKLIQESDAIGTYRKIPGHNGWVMDLADRPTILTAAIVTLTEAERTSKLETLRIANIRIVEPEIVFDKTQELTILVEFMPTIPTQAGVIVRMARLHKRL
jgi:hypothetical protein